MANKKERSHGGKEKKKRNNKQNNLTSEKKEEARNVSEQRVKSWIHVIRVHDTTQLSRQQHGRAKDAHEQRQNERSRETSRPPPLTCTSQMNEITRETKLQAKRKKTMNKKKRQVAQPKTLTQGGHEIACQLN